MNESIRTPIELLTDMLAAMTTRAIRAEAQRDEANTLAEAWFKNWQESEAKLKEAEAKLAEAEEFRETKEKIKDYIDHKLQKEEKENESSEK